MGNYINVICSQTQTEARWQSRQETQDCLAQTGSGDNATQNESQTEQRKPVVRVEEHPGVVEEDDEHANGKQAEHQPGHP